jgi:hypothetical protein
MQDDTMFKQLLINITTSVSCSSHLTMLLGLVASKAEALATIYVVVGAIGFNYVPSTMAIIFSCLKFNVILCIRTWK